MAVVKQALQWLHATNFFEVPSAAVWSRLVARRRQRRLSQQQAVQCPYVNASLHYRSPAPAVAFQVLYHTQIYPIDITNNLQSFTILIWTQYKRKEKKSKEGTNKKNSVCLKSCVAIYKMLTNTFTADKLYPVYLNTVCAQFQHLLIHWYINGYWRLTLLLCRYRSVHWRPVVVGPALFIVNFPTKKDKWHTALSRISFVALVLAQVFVLPVSRTSFVIRRKKNEKIWKRRVKGVGWAYTLLYNIRRLPFSSYPLRYLLIFARMDIDVWLLVVIPESPFVRLFALGQSNDTSEIAFEKHHYSDILLATIICDFWLQYVSFLCKFSTDLHKR